MTRFWSCLVGFTFHCAGQFVFKFLFAAICFLYHMRLILSQTVAWYAKSARHRSAYLCGAFADHNREVELSSFRFRIPPILNRKPCMLSARKYGQTSGHPDRKPSLSPSFVAAADGGWLKVIHWSCPEFSHQYSAVGYFSFTDPMCQ